MFHKFISSANLLNNYYVQGTIQDINQETQNLKMAIYSSKFQDVKCDHYQITQA